MKKKEIGMIIAILVIAVGMIFGVQYFRSANTVVDPNVVPSDEAKGQWVAIVHRNKVAQWFDSGVDATYTVEGDYGEMIVEVSDGKWHVSEVECPNHVCEGMGWDDGTAITPITCLPNNIIICTSDWVTSYVND